jgi:hypothetical protein
VNIKKEHSFGNNTMDDKEIIARYQAAAENEKYEAQMVWQTFSAFLLAQTIFLAFLLQSLFGKGNINGFYPGIYISAIFGLVICAPWTISFYRSMAFFNLRVDQAKNAEPEGWNLLNGKSIENGYYDFSPIFPKYFSKYLTTRCSVVFLIWVFILIYTTILLLSGPWNPTVSNATTNCLVFLNK